MAIDWKDLKSAEVIEDPEKIEELILRSQTKNKTPKTMTLEKDSETDLPILQKQHSFKIKAKDTEGAPKTPGDSKVESLIEARGMEFDEELLERVVPYWASDERVDGDGDIVRQNWIFEEFEKNSPMPFDHNWGDPPVGRIIDWQTTDRKGKDYDGPALWLLGVFAQKGDWEWADTVFRLVKSGILVSGSVGFFASKILNIEDPEERSELGLGRWGIIFEESHLLEFSPVTMPANSGAVSLISRHRKDLKPWDIHLIREMKRREIHHGKKSKRTEAKEWKETETLLLSIGRSIWPKSKWEPHDELDVPVIYQNFPEYEEDSDLVVPPVKDQDDTTLRDVVVAIETLTKSVDELSSSTQQQLKDICDDVFDIKTQKGLSRDPDDIDEEDDVPLEGLEKIGTMLNL